MPAAQNQTDDPTHFRVLVRRIATSSGDFAEGDVVEASALGGALPRLLEGRRVEPVPAPRKRRARKTDDEREES